MAAVSTLPHLSTVLYYLSYVDPRQLDLVAIYNIVMKSLWRGAPPKIQAIQLDRVQGGVFQRDDDFGMPTNEPREDEKRGFSCVSLPQNLLSTLEDVAIRTLFKYNRKTGLSLTSLRKLCLNDSEFFKGAVYAAHRKNSRLYALVHDAYLRMDHEEPREILYEPEGIEVKNKKICCHYKGTILTQSGKLIPFRAECSFDLSKPKGVKTNIFIDENRKAE